AARRYEDMSRAIERRDWRSAIAIGDEVVREAPRFGLARIQLAQAQSMLARPVAAAGQMHQAAAVLRPLPPEAAQRLLALTLSTNPSQVGRAVSAYAQLSRRNPDNLPLAIDYARLLTRVGNPQEALDELQAHPADQVPISVRIAGLLVQAEAYAMLGDPDRMRARAASAQRSASAAGKGWELDNADATLQMARADALQYPERSSLATYQKAAELYELGGNPTGALIARFYGRINNLPATGADAELEKLLAIANANGFRRLEFDALYQMALNLRFAGRMDDYRSRLEQAQAVAGAAADAVGYNRIGSLLAFQDLLNLRVAQAGERLRQVDRAKLHGRSRRTLDQVRSSLYQLRGEYREALTVLQTAERELPEQGKGELPSELGMRIACLIGEQQLGLGALDAARMQLERCASSREASTQSLRWLLQAQAETMSGNSDVARADLHRVKVLLPSLGDGPDRWHITLHLAMLLTRTGDYAASQRAYEQVEARSVAAEDRLSQVMIAIGRAENEAAQGHWQRARKLVEQTSPMIPADSWILTRRVDAVAAVVALASDDHELGRRLVLRLHRQAHVLGDVPTQIELHGLLPGGEWDRCCSEPGRRTLADRTGMRGMNLDWLTRAMRR
ncbi:MAG: tetratricopeptide repeat protein, partial [Lysobacter sp.]